MKLLPVQGESLGTRLGVHILLHCLCRPYKIYGLVPTSKIIQFHCNVASAKLDGISGTYALPTPTPHLYEFNIYVDSLGQGRVVFKEHYPATSFYFLLCGSG